MKGLGLSMLAVVGLVAGAWLLGNLLLEVQLPDRTARRGAFPEPMDPNLSLQQAFASLPDGDEENASLLLLEENSGAWLERWRLLEGARTRLDISYFILKQDVFGVAFLGHLVHKARQGVEIRLLLDAMGTRMSRTFQGNDYLDALVAIDRVAVRMYRPLPFRYLDAFLTLKPAAVFVSDHDKILLADDERALIGGRNISKEYFTPPEDDPRAFRDTDLLLFGPRLAATLKSDFEAQYGGGEAHAVERETVDLDDPTDDLLLAYRAMEAWLRGGPIPAGIEAAIRERDLPWLDELRQAPSLRGALAEPPPRVLARVRLVDSRCRLVAADDFITRSLIRMTRSARREIFIQSPYLVLPKEAMTVLAEAAGRGVAITVFTNSPVSSDNPMSQGVFLEQWPELLVRVPTLRLFVAGDRHNLHGKVAVFDRQLAVVGTYNLDPLSMTLNSELLAAAWSPELAAELLGWREELIAGGPPAVYEYRIARDDEGRPRRDRRGEVEVVFGPGDHVEPEAMKAAGYRRLFRWISLVQGDYPWF